MPSRQCFSDYCEILHRCMMERCPHARRTINYCDSHYCQSLDCKYSRLNEKKKKHCAIHACIIIECPSEKIDNSNYCSDHACIIKNCGKKRGFSGGEYCKLCRNNIVLATTLMMKRLKVVPDIQKLIQVLILRTIIRN